MTDDHPNTITDPTRSQSIQANGHQSVVLIAQTGAVVNLTTHAPPPPSGDKGLASRALQLLLDAIREMWLFFKP